MVQLTFFWREHGNMGGFKEKVAFELVFEELIYVGYVMKKMILQEKEIAWAFDTHKQELILQSDEDLESVSEKHMSKFTSVQNIYQRTVLAGGKTYEETIEEDSIYDEMEVCNKCYESTERRPPKETRVSLEKVKIKMN